MKNTFILQSILIGLISIQLLAQKMNQGIFSETKVIGTDVSQTSAIYNSEYQFYELAGVQKSNNDAQGIHLTRTTSGSFLLTVKIKNGTSGKGGLVIVDQDGKTLVRALRSPDGGVAMMSTEIASSAVGPKKNYEYLQLERLGSMVTLRACGTGEPFQVISTVQLKSLPETISVGLWLETSPTSSKISISEVRLDKLVPYNYDGDKDGHFGSRLEIFDVTIGEKKIIFESTERFEAPNFLPNGKELLFNMNGLLYTIPLTGGTPKQFNTGFANRNNNDHGISFDGKMLAISHHREGLPGGGSTVYVMPLGGGEPKLVTENTPSYWHGWNPNNREVVYVAQRNGSSRYQLYKKDINGGPETALTNFDRGHVDGPEYSPDGKYIYYNGSQSGTMQLWRMNPEGKNNEQLTFDELNNWFPHLSPDGKWIAYLSFPSDIHPDEHPAYKKVQLRMMPASGGAPRVLTHLFGGQGTINVPSWSPDNRYIAFVSNSEPKKK